MSTSTDRYGIGVKPPHKIRTADSPAGVARELRDLLVDVDQDTSWTVLDLITGDQIGGTVDGRHGTAGLATLLSEVAGLLHDPSCAPDSPYDLWVGHLEPQEIHDVLGLPPRSQVAPGVRVHVAPDLDGAYPLDILDQHDQPVELRSGGERTGDFATDDHEMHSVIAYLGYTVTSPWTLTAGFVPIGTVAPDLRPGMPNGTDPLPPHRVRKVAGQVTSPMQDLTGYDEDLHARGWHRVTNWSATADITPLRTEQTSPTCDQLDHPDQLDQETAPS